MVNRFNRKLVLLLAAVALLTGSVVLTGPRTALALPAASCDCTYYSDATYSTEVGWKSTTCSGQTFRSGNTSTAYKICYCDPC